jgi:hypothetical protein
MEPTPREYSMKMRVGKKPQILADGAAPSRVERVGRSRHSPYPFRDPLDPPRPLPAQKRPRPQEHAGGLRQDRAGGLRQDRAGDSLLLRGRAPAASAVPAPSPRALASTHRSGDSSALYPVRPLTPSALNSLRRSCRSSRSTLLLQIE